MRECSHPQTCHVSRVTCHVSRVTCHVSRVRFFFFFFDKVVELIGGGSVINGATPSSFPTILTLPEQHFSVWLFLNPGNKILFLLKFNEARISEWNVYDQMLSRGWFDPQVVLPNLEASLSFDCIGHMILLCSKSTNKQNMIFYFSPSKLVELIQEPSASSLPTQL